MSESNLSLTEMAKGLGFSRKKLLRMTAEGCPYERRGRAGQNYEFNPDAVRDWIKADAAKKRRKHAPSLSPSDPRYRERAAAAKIKLIKLAIRRKVLTPTEDFLWRVNDESTKCRVALCNIAYQFHRELDGASGDQVARLLAPAIERILDGVTIDDPESWPEPRPFEFAPMSFDETVKQPGGIVPTFAPDDPRYKFHEAQATAREAELRDLELRHVTLDAIVAIAKEQLDPARELIRGIPARVASALGSNAHSREIITDTIDRIVRETLTEICELDDLAKEAGEHQTVSNSLF